MLCMCVTLHTHRGLLYSTSTCLNNKSPWRKCRSRCFYKVSHCAGHILATRPHQLHWGDWEMGTAIKMQSGRWPYPHGMCRHKNFDCSFSLCNCHVQLYLLPEGIPQNYKKLPMIHNRMKLLPLCCAVSDTACIRTSPGGFSWSKDPAEWREMLWSTVHPHLSKPLWAEGCSND